MTGASELVAWARTSLSGAVIYEIAFHPIQRSYYAHLAAPAAFAARAPQTVIQVADASQVAALLTRANEWNTPVHARQGTGQVLLDVLNPFPPGSIILDLRRLVDLDVRPADGYVEVGAGVTYGRLQDVGGPLGYSFPIGAEPITWGGLASINTSHHAVSAVSDKPGAYVLGLQVVLPTGETIETGTKALRPLVGPDLTRLFLGGQGLFGIITRVRLRLVATSPGQARGWAVFDSLDGAATVARRLWSELLAPPELCELVERSFVDVSGLADSVGAGHLVLAVFGGYRQDEADWKLGRFLGLAEEAGARVKRVRDAEWRQLWGIRRTPIKAVARDGEYLMNEILDIPLSRLNEAFERVIGLRARAEQRWPGLRMHLWSHLASGTLHPAFFNPAHWPYAQRVEVARIIRAEILRLRLELDGSVGEHGIFPTHASWYEAHYGRVSLKVQRALKAALDPRNILNPNRLDPMPA
jgi:glycolate oxidase